MAQPSDIYKKKTSMANKIELAGQTSASIVTTVVSILTHDTLAGYTLQAIQPLMAGVFTNFIQCLSKRKERRAISLFSVASEIYNKRIKNGEKPIDELSLNEDEKIDINDFLESIIKTAIEDPETKKTKLYGLLLANMLFCDKLDISYYIGLLRIVNNMTYKDICLIKILKELRVINGGKWSRNNVSIETNMVIAGIKRLESIGLTDKKPPFSLGAPLDNLSLNSTGHLLYKLMELEEIEDKEISDIMSTVSQLNS